MTELDPRKKYWLIETPYGRLGAQAVDGRLWVHCDIWEWSKDVYKDCQKQWTRLLEHFRQHGIKRIFSAIPEQDPLVNKWQKLWGMKEVARDQGFVFYEKEL